MTESDRANRHPGYWPSAWPVECGGNRRQKARAGRLDAASGTAEVRFRNTGRWNVMAIEREPGQWYLGGTMAAFNGPPPYGWVERIDPQSLEATAYSGELPCGDHVWCGAILAHANGSIYSVNGSFLHRLSPDCEIEAEVRLPVERAHNGLLALSDGTLITKDLRLEGQGGTTVSRLDAETLELVEEPLKLPEGSMGRIASDRIPGGDAVYVPGTEHVWRIDVGDKMAIADELESVISLYKALGGGWKLGTNWMPGAQDDDENGEPASTFRLRILRKPTPAPSCPPAPVRITPPGCAE